MADPVRIYFLGGLGDIGRNCMVVEQDNRLLIIDCGLMFPDSDMHGIDLVLPDFTFDGIGFGLSSPVSNA